MKIALTFSGGGYRAAAYSLGVLEYLHGLQSNQLRLLDQVAVLSTVSGGTITGLRYALGVSQGENFMSVYRDIYTFMAKTDLVNEAINLLVNDRHFKEQRVPSLICAFAEVYDSRLFNGKKFGKLMQDRLSPHLRHMSFNSTEFDNALQFRFQWSEKLISPAKGEQERGLIGNSYIQVPEGVARELRLADILAASSCFPGGFEPINFPNDFVLPETIAVVAYRKALAKNVGLMDGGIVDNQGVDPVLLAEIRMMKNLHPGETEIPVSPRVLDLIMVADVASPFMEGFVASQQHPHRWWSNLSPALIVAISAIILILGAGLLYYGVHQMLLWVVIFATFLLTISAVFFLLYRILKKLPIRFHVPAVFLQPLGSLLKLKLYVYEGLLFNRSNSLLKLTMSVFLKHIRRLNYRTIYKDETWRNRRIMNAIYELKGSAETNEEKYIRAKKENIHYQPSEAVKKVAALASSMGTTLWFTRKQLEKDRMLDAIISCGQFTTCWNLLEYIADIKQNPINTSAEHRWILELEPNLLKDWNRFQMDPFWKIPSIAVN